MNLFICLEGVDAVGKTEVSQKLAQTLGYQYYKSPGGCFADVRSVVDENVDPLTRYFFYRAATQHDSRQIVKLLETTGVVCDRYVYSTIAVHAAMDQRVQPLFEITGIMMPHHTFVLTAREEVRKARLAMRVGIDEIERNLVLQDGADKLFRMYCNRVIDTSDNTVEETADIILAEITNGGNGHATS